MILHLCSFGHIFSRGHRDQLLLTHPTSVVELLYHLLIPKMGVVLS
jgi:hypothetical protein